MQAVVPRHTDDAQGSLWFCKTNKKLVVDDAISPERMCVLQVRKLEIAGASGSLDVPSALQELRQEDQMDRSSLKAKMFLDSCKASLSRNAVADVIHV